MSELNKEIIEDKSYQEASAESIGRFIGAIFTGLLDSMSREEALVIAMTYTQELVKARPNDSDNKV